MKSFKIKKQINMFNKDICNWWENLNHSDKIFYKDHFLKVKDQTANKFPNMYDIKDIRVNKLSDKQIFRIWCFKDYKLK